MISRVIYSLFATALGASVAFADCDPSRIDLRGDWGQARFSVEVADDPGERSMGLMHRESMAKSAGMLFVYERPQRVAFWMRNTLIPLDMIFIDADGVVTRIHENAVPLDETAIEGGDKVQYVLEINAGLAARFGLTPGSEVRHPAIAPEPIWACETQN